jgi:hypothetical protein
MPNQRLIKKLKQIAKSHKVSVRFNKRQGYYGGYYKGDKKSIVVVYTCKRAWFLSAFFHELAHVLEHRDGIYANYYKKRQNLTVKRKLALRAERHTDKRAKIICKKYFPKIRYKEGYRTKFAEQLLQDYYAD